MTRTQYLWKPGFRAPVKAQVVGERIEALREVNGGFIRPADVVDDARRKTSPLHPCFEWNNREAAEKFREIQAGELIRHITVQVRRSPEEEGESFETRAFVSVSPTDVDPPAYTSVVAVMADPDLRDQVLASAKQEMRRFRQRYEELQELRTVFAAMDAVLAAA